MNAAESIEATASTTRAEVYAFLANAGVHGATDEEVCDALAMHGNTERPRRVELVESGHVVDSTYRRYTKSNRMAVVWIVSELRSAGHVIPDRY